QTAGGPVATGQEFTILDTAGNGIVTGGELIALTMSVTPPDSVDDPGILPPGPAITGTDEGETLDGTQAAEEIFALGGDDVIRPG
ncbi:hypothetical protein AB9K41_23330, partial [Cribrihabitans sp. XS_ASV171]